MKDLSTYINEQLIEESVFGKIKGFLKDFFNWNKKKNNGPIVPEPQVKNEPQNYKVVFSIGNDIEDWIAIASDDAKTSPSEENIKYVADLVKDVIKQLVEYAKKTYQKPVELADYREAFTGYRTVESNRFEEYRIEGFETTDEAQKVWHDLKDKYTEICMSKGADKVYESINYKDWYFAQFRPNGVYYYMIFK